MCRFSEPRGVQPQQFVYMPPDPNAGLGDSEHVGELARRSEFANRQFVGRAAGQTHLVSRSAFPSDPPMSRSSTMSDNPAPLLNPELQLNRREFDSAL